MSVFKVVEGRRGERVLLETDDWVDALTLALGANWVNGVPRYVRGTHPSHQWGPPHEGQNPPGSSRCTACDAWETGGSYGSQSPCGYDWSKDALVTALWRENQARKSASPPS